MTQSNWTQQTINGGIKADATSSVVLNYTIGAGALQNSYFIVKVDTAETESDTGNNSVSSNPILIVNGDINRTLIVTDNVYYNFAISTYTTNHYYFNGTLDHAYKINWDDYYDGVNFLSLNSGADILVSTFTADGATPYFQQIDNGYITPQVILVGATEIVLLDAIATVKAGSFGVRVNDVGIPPNLTVTINSCIYNVTFLRIDFNINNVSATTASNGQCFYMGFWTDKGTAPVTSDIADSYLNLCPTIAASGTTNSTVDITTSDPGGLTNTFVYADIYGDVIENDETDNASSACVW